MIQSIAYDFKRAVDKVNKKSRYEITIFRKFTSICPHKINKDTIESLNPPHPDISLEVKNGEKLYFELVECVLECLAKQTGDFLKVLRENKELTKENYYPIGFKEDSVFNKAMEKFGKRYKADAPIELLAFLNEQAPPLGDALTKFSYFVKEKIGKSPFRRVWVYDVSNNKILFRFPEV